MPSGHESHSENREHKLTRREFLQKAGLVGAGLAAGAVGLGRLFRPAQAEANGPKEALHYRRLSESRVQCDLCPWGCVVSEGRRGTCRVRENRGGRYYSLVYGEAAALNVDPVEKKPLFHFHPGAKTLSVGTAGCNMRCKHCQNWDIAQRTPEELRAESRLVAMPPEKLVNQACANGIPIIAYTYNEPIIFYEYMYDTARLASQHGIKSVMISSGCINREPMIALAPYLDAIKIDLKGFTEEFYREYTSGKLQPVLETIKRIVALGKWLEIVYLVIPTVNDDPALISSMARWLVRAAGPYVPLHFSRFFPAYRLKNLPPTPIETLRRCRHLARQEGLKFVYVGNVPGSEAASTYCYSCGQTVIAREGYRILSYNLKPDGSCRFCGTRIHGLW